MSLPEALLKTHMFHYGEPATTRDFRLYLIHTRDKRRNNRILPGWRRLALPASSLGSHRGQRGLGLRVLVQAVGTQGGEGRPCQTPGPRDPRTGGQLAETLYVKKSHLKPSKFVEVELTKKEIYTGVPACSVRPVNDIITRDRRSSGL